MHSLWLQLLCVVGLCLAVGLNRLAWGDPKWPLLGMAALMGSWLLLALYTLLMGLWALYRQSWQVSVVPALGMGVACLPIVCVVSFYLGARQVPAIHDITTDTVTPPLFTYALTKRHPSHNSTDYSSENIALQAAAYSYIKPLVLSLPPSKALMLVQDTVKELGWQVHNVDSVAGVIEAYDTSPMLGFVDDIIIRITVDGQGSRIDVRSASRIGVSDLGANAQRIRAFLLRLGLAAQ